MFRADHSNASSFPDEQKALVSQEAIAWFVKIRSGPLAPHDQMAFEAWQRQSPAHGKAFNEIAEIWEDPALGEAAEQGSAKLFAHTVVAAWDRFREIWSPRRVGTALAMVALMVMAVWHLGLPTWGVADYWAPTGERKTFYLSDRSTVTLNAESGMAVEFTESIRRVRLLKGQALFAVAPNPGRPFVVNYGEAQVQAIGTEFIVGEHREGFYVSVVEGRVKLDSADGSWTSLPLSAGTSVDVVNGRPGQVQNIDPKIATAWVRGRLVVDAAPLVQVIDYVKPYHSGLILLLNSEQANLKVSGTYNLSDTSGILRTLSQTLPVKTLTLTDRVTVFF